MKKTLMLFLLFFISVEIYANSPEYPEIQACISGADATECLTSFINDKNGDKNYPETEIKHWQEIEKNAQEEIQKAHRHIIEEQKNLETLEKQKRAAEKELKELEHQAKIQQESENKAKQTSLVATPSALVLEPTEPANIANISNLMPTATPVVAPVVLTTSPLRVVVPQPQIECQKLRNGNIPVPHLDAVEGYKDLALDLYRQQKFDEFIEQRDLCNSDGCVEAPKTQKCVDKRKKNLEEYKGKLYSITAEYNPLIPASECALQAKQLSDSLTSEKQGSLSSFKKNYNDCLIFSKKRHGVK